jgi:uncharacterized LabA/DUF88 family protein
MTETPTASTSQDLQVSAVETEPRTPLLETDYDAIAAAVMETDRGRWFLQEYARRNRNSDTQTVLSAIEKLEKRISEEASTPKEATSVALLGHDLIDLAGAISQVKKEVADLGGQGDDPDHFNTATVELEAIVEQTESATSEILEAAEKIQEVTWILREEGASETQCDIIESKIVEVYTACSFQDLTGQRSNKVVQLVGYVERRVASMMSILGLSEEAVASPPQNKPRSETATESAPGLTPEQRNDARPDADLLNGPAMSGEGNEQGDVDALFGNDAFESAAPSEADTFALADSDSDTTAVDDGEELAFDQLDLSEQATAQTADETLEPVAGEVLVGNMELDNAEGATSDAHDDAPETVSNEVENTQDKTKADYGDDDEDPNTPEAADVFGFDVQADPELIELQDAEIISQSNEEAVSPTSTADEQAEQDIFEVDPLSFGGDAFGSTSGAEIDDNLEAETDGAPKAVVGLPGDFDVDSHVADVMVSADDHEASNLVSAEAVAETGHELIDGQDIFEADCVDLDTVGPETDTAEAEVMAQESSADDLASEDLVFEDQPSDDKHQRADQEAQADTKPIDAKTDAPSEGEMDDQMAALEGHATPDGDAGDATPTDVAEVNAAEELMEQVLVATSAEVDEADYPDDEYTAEERIALFS